MKKLNIITETYDAGNGFRIEVVQEGNLFEAWIYHKDYGIKALMFGAEDTKENFMQLVETGLDEEMEYYEEEYMD